MSLFYSRPSTNYAFVESEPSELMSKDKQRDLFPGALEMMILRTLKRQPLHGYALVQHIKRTSNDLLQIEEGSLYPALQRLLKEELVKAEWGISATNRRVRIYKLTPAGMKHLEHEVSRFERMLEGITRVLAPGES
jgi:PadR family transcriptional regulator PadR